MLILAGWGRRLRRGPEDDEAGLSILETVLALSLFALAIIGLATSAGAGLRLTGESNSRQGATQVATRFIEAMRAADWNTLGMPSGQTYDTTAGSPDLRVDQTATPKTFSVPPGSSLVEPLVDNGNLPNGHKPTEVEQGARRFQAYQYVTIPAGTTDQKRATVIVTYRDTRASGGTAEVAMSTIIFKGAIGFGASSTTSSSTTSTAPTSTTLASTTTTTSVAPAGCADTADGDGPIVTVAEIASGTGSGGAVQYVNSQSVQLRYAGSDTRCPPPLVQFKNETGGYGGFQPVTTATSATNWLLTPGDGVKTVTFRFVDQNGNQTLVDRTVEIDTVVPNRPSGLIGTITKSGNDITAKITWNNDSRDGAETAYVSSYEIRRRVGSGTPEFLAAVPVKATAGNAGDCVQTNATCSFSDLGPLGNTTYVYEVVAIDRAANASPVSNPTTCNPSGNGTVNCK